MPDGQTKKFDVIGLGCSCIDFLGIVPHLPRLDEEVEMIESMQQGGGEVATALVTLARLGSSVAYLGKVGDDPVGVMIRHDFQRHGVNTDQLLTVPGARSLSAIVLVDQKTGKRSIVAGKSTCGDLQARDIAEGFIEQAKFLHLDGTWVDAAIAAADRARRTGGIVVLDADVSALGPQVQDLIQRTDVLIASKPFAQEYTGCDKPVPAMAELTGAGPETVIVTLGDQGGVGHANGRSFRFSAFAVEVVDTTGAGDVFHGAFIYGLLQRWSTERVVQFAAAVAAIKCTKLGGRTGIPDLEMTQEFLEKRGESFRFEFL